MNPILERLLRRPDILASRMVSQIAREPCTYCGASPTGKKHRNTREHIIPRTHGGETHWENLTAACRRCNNRRGRMPLLKFLVLQSIIRAYQTEGKHFTKRMRRAAGFTQD